MVPNAASSLPMGALGGQSLHRSYDSLFEKKNILEPESPFPTANIKWKF